MGATYSKGHAYCTDNRRGSQWVPRLLEVSRFTIAACGSHWVLWPFLRYAYHICGSMSTMPTNNAAPIGTRAQQWYIEKMPGPDTAPIRTPSMVIEIPPTDAAPNGTRAQQWRVAMGAAAGEPQTRLPEGTAFLAGCLLTTDAGPIGCRSFGTYMHGSQSVSHFTDIFKMSTTDTGPNGCRVVAGIIVDLPTTDAAPYGDRVFYKYMYYLPTTHTAPYGDRVFCRYAYYLPTADTAPIGDCFLPSSINRPGGGFRTLEANRGYPLDMLIVGSSSVVVSLPLCPGLGRLW
ncbi:hypothetical protein P692DRAFT_20823346 [Suillus brevipes Sb2]|nr:hypothetical protein P692DRAFT_20823346 [Suillus brevipes Sb2]